MADRKDNADDAVATMDSGAEAAEHQPAVETPDEIATQKAAVKAGPDERRAAMAAENATTITPTADDRDRQERETRANQMATENAASTMPLDDHDERQGRALRAAQMAGENNTGAAS